MCLQTTFHYVNNICTDIEINHRHHLRKMTVIRNNTLTYFIVISDLKNLKGLL